MEYVLYAENILILDTWKQTTLLLGVKAEKQVQKTARCFVENVTEGNQIDKKRDSLFGCLFHFESIIVRWTSMDLGMTNNAKSN